jgi:RNA-directed DNA polymerase
MIKTPVNLQDLRRKIYQKAKSEPTWRFWGLYVHVCKIETLTEAYVMAKQNRGRPGIDEVSFDDIEKVGVDSLLAELQGELESGTYRPLPPRKVEIPKSNSKTRTIQIPAIRDRIVQGALKLILEPIFESDFQDGSFGYRPKRTAHQAIARVERAIAQRKTQVYDLDLKSYFDNVRHHILFGMVAMRVNDDKIMRLLKLIVKGSGKRGVPQGGVISPLLSNIYLNDVDKMLEKAKSTTAKDGYHSVEYARCSDDRVVLVNYHWQHAWIMKAIQKRFGEELQLIEVELNTEKTKTVDLCKGESFEFLGIQFRRVRTRKGKWRPHLTPTPRARKSLLQS